MEADEVAKENAEEDFTANGKDPGECVSALGPDPGLDAHR